MITPEQLAEWKRLADEATPEPWTFEGRYIEGCAQDYWMDGTARGDIEKHVIAKANGPESQVAFPNAAFIAAAREAVPALVAELARLNADNAWLRGLIKDAEWSDDTECHWCGVYRYNNHTGDENKHSPDCPAFTPEGVVK